MENFEINKKLNNADLTLQGVVQKLNIEQKQGRLAELSEILDDVHIWDDPEKAIKITKEVTTLKNLLNSFQTLQGQYQELKSLLDLIDLNNLAENQLYSEELTTYLSSLEEFETKVLLSEPYDQHDCFLKLQPGEGGVEAMDWALMLLRMYQRWAKLNNYQVEILEYSAGEEAGIKSALIKISGDWAYGYLKSERGVHRLIRLSPFNSLGKRQTSFASVNVFPHLETSDPNIIIKDTDVRVDVFRSGGAGGQSVNTTDSAVRITHFSSGIVVSIQNERSQLLNKEKAFEILKALLFQRALDENNKKLQALKGEAMNIGFGGSQIRTYVFHPYQLIKDHRSGFEESDTAKVLDGYLNGFTLAYLRGNNEQEKKD
ncbi:MAG: peptide chain release factor 2 [Acholeplasmatales bacterium]|jgi:peptide chain release factor 2|nr:peptide chain release factor 2 [Acholeplasmatales bacterium]